MEQGQDINGFVDRHGVKHGVGQKPVGKIGDDTASVAASDNFVFVRAANGGVHVDVASLYLNIHNEESGTELNITPKEAANLYKAAQDWDEDPTEGSPNIVTSDGIYCALDGKMNVPNNIITGYSTWTETVRQSIAYLYNAINENRHLEWGEVSDHLYLFKERKWTDKDAKSFLLNLWNYAGC